MEQVKRSFADHPRKWDYAVILTLALMLASTVGYIANSEIAGHNMSEDAHPQITGQLESVAANQMRQYILQLDAALCGDPRNQVYLREIAEQIAKYEQLTGTKFPHELLQCARGLNSE